MFAQCAYDWPQVDAKKRQLAGSYNSFVFLGPIVMYGLLALSLHQPTTKLMHELLVKHVGFVKHACLNWRLLMPNILPVNSWFMALLA